MGPCSGRGARITMSCQCYAQCHRWGPISDATAVPSLSSSLLSWPSRSAVAIAATAVPPILLLRVRAPPRCHGQPEPSRPQRQSFKLSCCPGWPGPPSVRARPSVGIPFYPPPSTRLLSPPFYPPPSTHPLSPPSQPTLHLLETPLSPLLLLPSTHLLHPHPPNGGPPRQFNIACVQVSTLEDRDSTPSGLRGPPSLPRLGADPNTVAFGPQEGSRDPFWMGFGPRAPPPPPPPPAGAYLACTWAPLLVTAAERSSNNLSVWTPGGVRRARNASRRCRRRRAGLHCSSVVLASSPEAFLSKRLRLHAGMPTPGA